MVVCNIINTKRDSFGALVVTHICNLIISLNVDYTDVHVEWLYTKLQL